MPELPAVRIKKPNTSTAPEIDANSGRLNNRPIQLTWRTRSSATEEAETATVFFAAPGTKACSAWSAVDLRALITSSFTMQRLRPHRGDARPLTTNGYDF